LIDILTIAQIQSIFHEPQFKLFCQTPIYELTTNEKESRFELIEQYDCKDQFLPWRQLEFLLGEDESYHEIVSKIMKEITKSLENLDDFCKAI
jgi:hypothetical protein